MQRPYIPPLIILIVTFVLYGGFLHNQVVFDDLNFLRPDAIDKFFAQLNLLSPRQIPYWSLAITLKWLGPGLFGFRIVSLLLHAAVAISLYFFLRQVQKLSSEEQSEPLPWLPLLAALMFAVHPVAVYGAAYLIERTIVMATLFSLLSWTCVLLHLRTRSRCWLWGSVAFYALAVLCKEHAVMVPAVSVVLVIWWLRSQQDHVEVRKLLHESRSVIAAYIVVGLLVVMYSAGVLGKPYELEAQRLLGNKIEHAWSLSVITQSYLYFKYLLLWLIPNPLWMSLDMRETFAEGYLSWPYAMGAVAFLFWPVLAGRLLWQGGRRGLIGVAMLAPWLLFLTELSSIRIQEIFVLYRSYLWFAPAFVFFLAFKSLERQRMLLMLMIVPVFLSVFALDRLVTFSQPYFAWDDAVRLVESKSTKGLTGLERIYRNRGLELYKLKMWDLAVKDFSTSLEFNPAYYYSMSDRGAALLELKRYPEALADFDQVLREHPDYALAYAGRAKVLSALGRQREAYEAYRSACAAGWKPGCTVNAGSRSL